MFDDPNLLTHAGLAPLMALADRARLPDLLAGVRPGGPCGVNAAAKVACLLGGMAAGADSIDGMDLLRDGAMQTLFGGVRAPSTLGSHLRSYAWGNVRQLDRAHRGLLAALAGDGRLLPGRETLAFTDIDSTQKRVYGYQKEGAAYGHAKIAGKSLLVKGLNALISVISTPLSAPVTGPVRLRGGNAGSARGAAGLTAEAIGAAREAGCTGKIVVPYDSAYCNSAVIGTARRHGAHFSVTVPMNTSIQAAIAGIPEDAWTAIEYPQALWDDQLGCWVSDAEVAETEYAAFTSRPRKQQVTARLIVRRVRAKNEKAAHGMDELFPAWRHHAVFTDSPSGLIQAEGQHRDHAITGQVNADLYAGALAHLPSGHFGANAAWLVIAAMACNLLPAGGTLAGGRHPISPHRHDPPRPDHRRRAHRPPRPREPRPPPARGPPPRAGLAEPVDRNLRAARPRGLTSPEPVRTLTPQGTPTPRPRPRNPRTRRRTVSGRASTPENTSRRRKPKTAAPDI